MLDRDLAELYGVDTRHLNEAVVRNAARFPSDFAFQVPTEEITNLMSQFATSSLHGGRRKPVRVFTEQGVAMLSSVLKSRRAIDVNVAIMRAFVHLRELLVTHKDLAHRIDELEKKYDGTFAAVFDAIRGLMSPPAEERRARVGFMTEPDARATSCRSVRSGCAARRRDSASARIDSLRSKACRIRAVGSSCRIAASRTCSAAGVVSRMHQTYPRASRPPRTAGSSGSQPSFRARWRLLCSSRKNVPRDKPTHSMINLRNDNTNAMIGAISEGDLQLLVAAFPPESATEQTFVINRAAVDRIGDGGKASVHMMHLLHTAVGSTEGVGVRWKRS